METDVLGARNVEIVHRGQRDTVDVLGIWCEWKTTEDETNHHYSVMEMTVPPGAGVPPPPCDPGDVHRAGRFGRVRTPWRER